MVGPHGSVDGATEDDHEHRAQQRDSLKHDEPPRFRMSQSFLYLRCATRAWSRSTQSAVLAVLVSLAGCSEGAKLVKADGTGGTVIYPFGERGSLLSPFRQA